MGPEEHAADGVLTRRHARRALRVVLALAALVVAVPVIHAARVRTALARVNESGGFVRSYTSPLPRSAPWINPVTRLFLELYPVREEYLVSYGKDAGGWCGTGLTLAMGPYPAGDPGDAGLAAVGDLRQTHALELQGTSVSDAGLVGLRPLAFLQRLELDGTKVLGPGLAHLRSPKLESLSLAHTEVDDTGLRHLGDLPALAYLDLAETRIAGPGLAHLTRYPALRYLRLGGPHLRGDSFRHLAGLPLARLVVEGPSLTDDAIEHLEKLADLEWVSLCGARLTDEALARSRSKVLRDWALSRAVCAHP